MLYGAINNKRQVSVHKKPKMVRFTFVYSYHAPFIDETPVLSSGLLEGSRFGISVRG